MDKKIGKNGKKWGGNEKKRKKWGKNGKNGKNGEEMVKK